MDNKPEMPIEDEVSTPAEEINEAPVEETVEAEAQAEAPVEETPAVEETPVEEAPPFDNPNPEAPKPPKKKLDKKLLTIIISAAAAFLVIVGVTLGLVFGLRDKTPDDSDTDTGTNTDTDSGNVEVGSKYAVAPILKYLRIDSLGTNKTTIRFNALGSDIKYDIRYSDKEITEDNFDKATQSSALVTGTGEVKKAIVNEVVASNSSAKYIAVRATTLKEDTTLYSDVLCIRVGGIELVKVDPNRIDSIYCGEVIQDFTALIDEQDKSGNPYAGRPDIPISKVPKHYWAEGELTPGSYVPHKETHSKYAMTVRPIIDLETEHYVECIYLYYGVDSYPVEVRTSLEAADYNTPEAWDGVIVNVENPEKNNWTKIEVKKETRYVQICYCDTDVYPSAQSQAPTEVLIYGYATGSGDEITSTVHKLPLLNDMMGACGFTAGGGGNTTREQLANVGVLREYVNLGWVYSNANFPGKATTLIGSSMGNFDENYRLYGQALTIIPCLQWNEGSNPARYYDKLTGKLITTKIASEADKFKPDTYAAYADMAYQYAARYGSSKMGYLYDAVAAHQMGTTKVGLNYLQWIELGNEPNGEDQNGTTPYQLAALTSAAYDGHQRTVLSEYYNGEDFTYFFGAKTADPDFKVGMAGLAGIGNRYITAMVYWMKANRTDGCIAMDAFNVHTYFGKSFELNGQQLLIGVSPEEYGLVDAMSYLVEFRDKYYPNVEVWLTEFGWDTVQSYETKTACHAYGEYSGREVQAMWLARAYLLLAASGVDKATMYMVEGGDDSGTTGNHQYGTCGFYATEMKDKTDDEGNVIYDEDGKALRVETGNMIAKESYYIVYTLKTALGDMRFNREIDSGNDDVWVYEFTNEAGKRGYALWCPTSNGTKVNDYKLFIDADDATLITNNFEDHRDYKDEQGRPTDVEKYYQNEGDWTNLVADNGYVSVNVSENPIYVIID